MVEPLPAKPLPPQTGIKIVDHAENEEEKKLILKKYERFN